MTPKKAVSFTPKRILFFGRILQALSKKLTVIFVAKLFRTPIRHKIAERELMMRKSATEEWVTIPSINKEIMVYTYGYSKQKVLLVHGWSGRGTQFYKIADKLLEKGMMVITFDAPAHGQSKGKTTMMNEFVSIIKFLTIKNKGFYAAIGHSIGAMALLESVANGLQISKLVSIAATDTIDEIIDKSFMNYGLKPSLIAGFILYFKKKYKVDLENYNGSKFAKQIDIPTLIIHDSKDVPADVSSAYKIRQSLKNGELLVTNGNGHTRILGIHKIVNRITTFLTEN